MHLMVYAPYGRAGIYMLQEFCRRLGIGATDEGIQDLIAALRSGQLAGAGLDVTVHTPDGRTELTRTQERDDATILRWTDTDVSGIYHAEIGVHPWAMAIFDERAPVRPGLAHWVRGVHGRSGYFPDGGRHAGQAVRQKSAREHAPQGQQVTRPDASPGGA